MTSLQELPPLVLQSINDKLVNINNTDTPLYFDTFSAFTQACKDARESCGVKSDINLNNIVYNYMLSKRELLKLLADNFENACFIISAFIRSKTHMYFINFEVYDKPHTCGLKLIRIYTKSIQGDFNMEFKTIDESIKGISDFFAEYIQKCLELENDHVRDITGIILHLKETCSLASFNFIGAKETYKTVKELINAQSQDDHHVFDTIIDFYKIRASSLHHLLDSAISYRQHDALFVLRRLNTAECIDDIVIDLHWLLRFSDKDHIKLNRNLHKPNMWYVMLGIYVLIHAMIKI